MDYFYQRLSDGLFHVLCNYLWKFANKLHANCKSIVNSRLALNIHILKSDWTFFIWKAIFLFIFNSLKWKWRASQWIHWQLSMILMSGRKRTHVIYTDCVMDVCECPGNLHIQIFTFWNTQNEECAHEEGLNI